MLLPSAFCLASLDAMQTNIQEQQLKVQLHSSKTKFEEYESNKPKVTPSKNKITLDFSEYKLVGYTVTHNTDIISAGILQEKLSIPIVLTCSQWPSIKITYKQQSNQRYAHGQYDWKLPFNKKQIDQWTTESFLDNCFLLGACENGMVIFAQRRLNQIFGKQFSDDLLCNVTLYAVFFEDVNNVNKQTGRIIEKTMAAFEEQKIEKKFHYDKNNKLTVITLASNASFTGDEIENYQHYFPKVGITQNSAVIIHTQDAFLKLRNKKNIRTFSYQKPAFSYCYKKQNDEWHVNTAFTDDFIKDGTTDFDYIKNIHMLNQINCLIVFDDHVEKIAINEKSSSSEKTVVHELVKFFDTEKNETFGTKKHKIIATAFNKENKELHVLYDYRDTVQKLLDKTVAFKTKFPELVMQHANQLEQFLQKNKNKKTEVKHYAQNAKIFVHAHVKNLIKDFIAYKKTHGTQKEKEYYAHMTEKKFIQAIVEKKYFIFFNANVEKNKFIINDGNQETTFNNFNEWKMYQTSYEQSEDFNLEKSLTIDEIKIASLISMMSQTHFINRGDRHNNAKIESEHLSQGYVAVQVDCCFETENWLEWQDILITADQNKIENGYGTKSVLDTTTVFNKDDFSQKTLLTIWKQFYQLMDRMSRMQSRIIFPTFDEAQKHFEENQRKDITQLKYIPLDREKSIYFHIYVYRSRMKAVIEPFLKEAEAVGKAENKAVLLYVTGLGLGNWSYLPKPYNDLQSLDALPKALQQEFKQYFDLQDNQKINVLKYLCTYLQIKIYEEYFESNKATKVKKLYFAWFLNKNENSDTELKLKANEQNTVVAHQDEYSKALRQWNQTEVFWTTLPPASHYFEDPKFITVSNVSSNGTTQVGNQYWFGKAYLSQLEASAAASCSYITTYLNPFINEQLLENIEFIE
ncbi:DUF4804 domain-containing protein [bacterium]|nr:MAG: DUF4804 domain-containing protein [bacterium]